MRTIVVGAGAGGLAAAMQLQAAGYATVLLDQHPWPGGKMRSVNSSSGPIDAGPTVLTLRHIFDDLFQSTGADLNDYLQLTREACLARHFWPDGSRLDLFDDREKSCRAVKAFSGSAAAAEFDRFTKEAQSLFETFDEPMIQTAEPSLARLAKAAMSAPGLLINLVPGMNLAARLSHRFSDARLRQLFGRYATYVGGSPLQSPALLSLIWRAEEAGIWRVTGGLYRLANAMAQRFIELGGDLRLGTHISRIRVADQGIVGVETDDHRHIDSDIVIYAGDPRALAIGKLGDQVKSVAPVTTRSPRSFSAHVWSFAATASIPELIHHNVFFAADPISEFSDLAVGRIPREPTIYVCAQDRGSGLQRPSGTERFEIILNAPALSGAFIHRGEKDQCRKRTFSQLAKYGLTFQPIPSTQSLTTPTDFDTLFPGSAGALYGQSPAGITAGLRRPRARTAIRGLYLAGGGTHPGAGVPMSALSGKHAAAMISADRALI
ncbi:MAG: phytoene desaturase family protein [Rhodobacteraceae bacterium]|nr:phytoene desaturase family protein [Paracoccaceae bacterium]MCY4197708.1 phytoene desaturase family protein [Paracoccaceae bacterium]MCY4327958.1 phytoene desaturase family protein [Paracoccaceae bacterium]